MPRRSHRRAWCRAGHSCDAADCDDLGVAAGGEKQAVRERDRVGEPRRERVGLQMIDRDQRHLPDQRDRLGGGEADDHAADQPGAGGGRDAVDRIEAAASLRHGVDDDVVERLDMGTGGDLRDHARHRPHARSPATERHWTESGPPPVELRSTTAAAVSSQVVSMPRMRINQTRRAVVDLCPGRYCAHVEAAGIDPA